MARRRSSNRRARRSRGLFAFLVFALALALAYSLLSPPRPLRRWWSEHQGLARVEAHAPLIRAAACESGVDANLLAGVMMVESRGHVAARSPVGALGLFQLMLPTAVEQAQRLGLPEPSKEALVSDGELNARLGARYLAWLLRRFDGDEERVLIAYNAGPGRLKRWTEEAGSYAAWRDARERAGDSAVLAYVRDVQHYRQRFADRGAIAPIAVRGSEEPPAGEVPSGAEARPEPGFIGPSASNSKQ